MKLLIGIVSAVLCIIFLSCAPQKKEYNFREMEWDDVVEHARGQDVYWYSWGGSTVINKFIDEYVAVKLKEEFDITLYLVPVSDTALAVSKVQGEQQGGRHSDGSVDLIWINGENFRTLHTQGLLYGPYADILPNIVYVNQDDPTITHDFGYPVNHYESPYGAARIAFIYDSAARMEKPFMSMAELQSWVKRNPGIFTYPAIPDFTGSAFVRHVFYHVAGGYEEFQGEFNQDVYDQYAGAAWEYLNELEPYLWRGGNTYPENRSQLQILYEQGEIFYDITYHPNDAATYIVQGRYPETSRTYILDDGTIGNSHFVAIPYNASHKAAALVTANFLLEPSVQLYKSRPEVWGDYSVLDPERLSEEWKKKFQELPVAEAVLQPKDITQKKLPEMHASWLESIEQDWITEVLQK